MPPPRKKDRLRGSLSPVREQFPPTGTLCGGQAELPGKSRPDEGAKTAPAEAGDCAQAAPWGNGRQWGCLVPGKHRTGRPPGQRVRPGAKQPQAGVGGLCADCAHGGAADIMCGVVLGSDRPGCPPGQRVRPGAKQPPAEAGGCLDAGYGCYLPRAIRVIWMHRVGSTARPRIMPS